MENKLRECPFCGEPATPGFGAQGNFVRCTGCRCRTWLCYDTAAKAIAAWNTRASDNRKCGDCKYFKQCKTLDAMEAADLPVSYNAWHCADFVKREDK